MLRTIGLSLWLLFGLVACAPQPTPPSTQFAPSDFASVLLDSELGPAMRVLQERDPARFNAMAAEMADFYNTSTDPDARFLFRMQIGRKLRADYAIYVQNAPNPLMRRAFDDFRTVMRAMLSRPALCGKILNGSGSGINQEEVKDIARLFTQLTQSYLLAAFEGRFRPVSRAAATRTDFDAVFADAASNAAARELLIPGSSADPADCATLVTLLDQISAFEGPAGERVMAGVLAGILPR